jgi:hypothetical protein
MRKYSPHTLERTTQINAIVYNLPWAPGQRLYLQTNVLTYGKRVKMIAGKFLAQGNVNIYALTLRNRDGIELITRYPLFDLLSYPDQVGNKYKPRLFDLYDVDTANSFLEYFNPGSGTTPVGEPICSLTFNLAQ